MMLFNGISIKLLAGGGGCFFNSENWECVTADAILNGRNIHVRNVGREAEN